MTDAKPAPKKRGPKSRYSSERMDQRARDACLLGCSNADLGRIFDVPETTITYWLKVHPTFRQAVYDGRDGADEKVTASLYQRACGYSHPDVHISNYKGVITITPIVKHYPPEVGAAIFWLNNRQRGRWQAHPENNTATNDLGAALAQIIKGLPA